MNGVVGFTGGATLPVGGAILALGALSALRRPTAVRPLLSLLAAGVALILGLGLAAIVEPGLVPSVPEPRSPAAWAVLVAGLAFYGLLFWRALRTFRLTRRSADLLGAVGIPRLSPAPPAAPRPAYWDPGRVPQSLLIVRIIGLATMTCCTSAAISRSFSGFGPVTR